ncbi:MAG: ThiF family adenylyltransferase [Micrococcaceae bacterium]|nr:ThiF family adenylyltransferase [Micrococcaceae bacterium]
MTGLAPVDQQYIHWLATEDGSTVEPPPHGSLSPDPGPRRRRELLDLLAPVLEDSYRLPGALGASLVPDVNAYSVAYTAPAGELVRQRSRSAARIHGLGRCGQTIASLLAASGIGGLYLNDEHPVLAGDIGIGPLRMADLGKSRTVALAHRLGQQWPRTRLTGWAPGHASSGVGARITVVTACDALPESWAAHLAGTRMPHLPVVFGPAWARVGPLVIPGLTTCLDCAQPPVGAPMAGPRAAGTPRPGSSTAELALSCTAAGLAAVQILMLLDGVNVPSTADAMLTIDLATGGVQRVPVQPRSDCTCMVPAA